MVSFDDLVLLDGMPIYQQILRHVKLGIAGGTIAPGDALPSRRVLSALLGVNPNTASWRRRASSSPAPGPRAAWPPTRPPGPGCGGTCSGRRPSPWWPP